MGISWLNVIALAVGGLAAFWLARNRATTLGIFRGTKLVVGRHATRQISERFVRKEDIESKSGGQSAATKEEAHTHCFRHRAEIMISEVCGCFYCEKTFAPSEIAAWTDDGQSALCPKCGIDSVIGSASGLPITAEFLQQMNEHWFG